MTSLRAIVLIFCLLISRVCSAEIYRLIEFSSALDRKAIQIGTYPSLEKCENWLDIRNAFIPRVDSLCLIADCFRDQNERPVVPIEQFAAELSKHQNCTSSR